MALDVTTRHIDPSLPAVNFGDLPDSTVENCLISIIMNSRGRPEFFQRAISSLANTCTSLTEIEILLKIDTDDTRLGEYINICEQSPFFYRVLVSDRLSAYWTLHLFVNELAKLAHGSILWIFNEDNKLISGDWVRAFRATRDVYPDNIYVAKVPGSPPFRHKTIAPACSIEWFNVLGIVSPHPFCDFYLSNLANRLGRFITNKQLESMDFRHRDQKTHRPRINLGHAQIRHLCDVKVNAHLPKFQEALNS